ncbi:MAG: putative transposase YbfD/YdcC, partial [Arenicella sp.]
LYPAMTEQISEAGGTFLIGLKENQSELLADMKACITHSRPINKQTTYDKGHGRVETRHYCHYDVSKSFFDERWALTNFQSLFKVERIRYEITTGKESLETSYYISNMAAKANNQYFNAIRGHWSVETNNHIRDVTLREDLLRTKKNQFPEYLPHLELWSSNFSE